MKFTKMHGIGNDYVYVNTIENPIADPEQVSIQVSKFHFGIGSDGLILVGAASEESGADFSMDIYNADGSRAKMCGNGVRCVGKFVYDHAMTSKETVKIETQSGVKILALQLRDAGPGEINNNGKVVASATVDMQSPILTPEKVPVLAPADFEAENIKDCVPAYLGQEEKVAVKMPLEINDTIYYGTAVSMGNPHFVTFIDDVANFPLAEIGPLFEMNRAFPDRVNSEFAQVQDANHITMRVWERGSGETLACGTGACATAVAAILNGKCNANEEIEVKLLGGTLKIKWDLEKNTVFMTGPATTTFGGVWFEEQ